ncbi:MAG: glycosyltransferase family 2 protein [Proteobacteria bacterium]|nr:glycosyltransferase family 2 protein [Pseudomonadota bacterium]
MMIVTLLFELVVPCFNEAESLELLIQKSAQSALEFGLSSLSFQLVLVDNGSRDKTQEVLTGLKRTDWGKWFRVVTLEVNQGYGGGISEGLKTTQAPWVGFTHADLQCDPKDALRAFLDCKKRSGPVIVQGERKNRDFSDWIVSRVFEFFVGVIWGFWAFDLNAQPKVFSRELLEKIKNPPTGIPLDAFILWRAKENGFFKKRIEVHLARRRYGHSHWNFGLRKKLTTFLKVVRELLKVRLTAQSQ